MATRARCSPLCEQLGLERSDDAGDAELERRARSTEVYPWGTIRTATPEANRATAEELSDGGARRGPRAAPGSYLEALGYDDFLA